MTTNIYNFNVQLAINWNGDFAAEVCHRVFKNVKKVFELRKQPLCFCVRLFLIHFTLKLEDFGYFLKRYSASAWPPDNMDA